MFLRLRGLEHYADRLYELGARQVRDLSFLEDEDWATLGINKRELLVQVQ